MTRPTKTDDTAATPDSAKELAKSQSRQTLDALRGLVEDSDLRHRDIEGRAGWSRGYLSQVLGGHIELRLEHVEILLSALKADPARFFRTLYPRRRPTRPFDQQDRSRSQDRPRLKINRDMLEVSGLGIEALHRLQMRLGHCERALTTVARQTAIQRRIKDHE